MKHKQSEKISVWKIIAVMSAIVIGGALIFWGLHWLDNRDVVPNAGRNLSGQVEYEGEIYAPRHNLETVLLIGVDKFDENLGAVGYNNQQQADLQLLFVLDREQRVCRVLHLNRDTMTVIPELGLTGEVVGYSKAQLALSHTYGSGGDDSCRNAVEAVSYLLYGQRIDHYVSITMDAVGMLNDLVGGVTVEVTEDMTKVDPSFVKGTQVTLHGPQALAFVRARGSLEDSSNLSRMERQRRYMAALEEALDAAVEADPDFAAKALEQLSPYLFSDVSGNRLLTMTEELKLDHTTEILYLDGEAVEGEKFMEFYVDESSLQHTVLDLFYTPVS